MDKQSKASCHLTIHKVQENKSNKAYWTIKSNGQVYTHQWQDKKWWMFSRRNENWKVSIRLLSFQQTSLWLSPFSKLTSLVVIRLSPALWSICHRVAESGSSKVSPRMKTHVTNMTKLIRTFVTTMLYFVLGEWLRITVGDFNFEVLPSWQQLQPVQIHYHELFAPASFARMGLKTWCNVKRNAILVNLVVLKCCIKKWWETKKGRNSQTDGQKDRQTTEGQTDKQTVPPFQGGHDDTHPS